jgi:hypothetical protein
MPPERPNAATKGYGNQHVHSGGLAQNLRNDRALVSAAATALGRAA